MWVSIGACFSHTVERVGFIFISSYRSMNSRCIPLCGKYPSYRTILLDCSLKSLAESGRVWQTLLACLRHACMALLPSIIAVVFLLHIPE